MDETDVALAKDREEQAVSRGLAMIHHRLHATPDTPLAAECEHCGFVIPERRRKAMPNCRLCVDCQNDEERR